jgi:tryptophanase
MHLSLNSVFQKYPCPLRDIKVNQSEKQTFDEAAGSSTFIYSLITEVSVSQQPVSMQQFHGIKCIQCISSSVIWKQLNYVLNDSEI